MRVTLAEDQALLREGMARLLVESGFEVIGQAADAEELLRLVAADGPDVAIVDIKMPPTHSDEGIPHGRGALQSGHLRTALPQREDHRDARTRHLHQARLEPASNDHRRVLAVLAYLRS